MRAYSYLSEKTRNLFNRLLTFVYFSFFLIKKRNVSVYISAAAIGDTCYALAFSKYLLQKGESHFFICEKQRELVLSSYPFFDTNNISFYKVNSIKDTIISTLIFSRRLRTFFKRKKIFVLYMPISNKLYNSNLFSLLCAYNFNNLPLPYLTYPQIPSIKISSIPNIEEDCNKIVICNPYSNSMSLDNHEYLWEEIVAILKRKGYDVYTNVIDGQQAIKGSHALDCSILEFANIAQRVKAVISIRTGLLDYIINTPCLKFIIYGYCNDPNVNSETMFNVYNMDGWRKTNIVQTVSLTNDKVLTDFMSFINTYNI